MLQSFMTCDGEGAVRGAILYTDRSCLFGEISKLSTVNPLYNDTHYNSKILNNVILISTELYSL